MNGENLLEKIDESINSLLKKLFKVLGVVFVIILIMRGVNIL